MSTTPPRCKAKGGPAYCPDPKCPEKAYGLQLIKQGKTAEYLELRESQKARAAKINPVEGFFLAIGSYVKDGRIRKNDAKFIEQKEKVETELSRAKRNVTFWKENLQKTRFSISTGTTLKEADVKAKLEAAEIRLKKAEAASNRIDTLEWSNSQKRI